MIKLCDKNQWPAPVYTTVRTEGPPHNRLFVVEVSTISGKFVSNRGYTNLKMAREQAALNALQHV